MSKGNKKSLDPKKPICKELDCSNESSVKGYCRLHFLKVVKKGPDAVSAETSKGKKERRSKGDRLIGIDSPMDNEETMVDRENLVQELGNLDTDVNSVLEMDELLPFKKTG